MYRDHRKGPGGPPGGATHPGGPQGLKWGREPAPSGLVPRPWAPPKPRVENPRVGGAPHLPWGALHPPWPPPPWEIPISWAGAPPGGLYKGGGERGQPHPVSWRLPPPATPCPPPTAAWRSRAGVLLHPPPRRCDAGSSSTSPSPLLDQEGGDVIRSICVLNAEVLSVRHLVIGDLDHGEYDSIIPVPLNASARDLQVVCRCNLSPITRCLDELIDGSW